MSSRITTVGGGVLVAVALLALAELGARLSGAAAAAPGRVLDPRAVYLPEHPREPGTFVTDYWEDVRDELVLRPRAEATRVVLFGGSSAWAFRDEMLHGALSRAAPDVDFQVVNLGRNGYGSERVARLFEEAVEKLEPHVVVLYLGNNEFVESPFPRPVRELPAELRGSHALRLAAVWAAALRRPEHVRPEPWVPDWTWYMGLDYERTLEQLALYRSNVEGMIELAAARGARVALCTVVYNRYSAPHATRPAESLSAADLARVAELREQVTALLPDFLRPLLPVHKDDRVRRMDWDLDDRESAARQPGARDDGRRVGLRPLTGALAGLDVAAPPPERWHARLWGLNECLAHLWSGPADEAERARLTEAAELLDELLAIAPDHPRGLFERALLATMLGGAPAEVRRLLVDAARYDRAPKKASELVNDALRELAERHPSVLLLDADRVFAEGSPNELVGWEVMYDHCHMLPGPSKLVMDLLGREVAAAWFGGEGD